MTREREPPRRLQDVYSKTLIPLSSNRGRATWDCDLRPLNICCRQLRQETSPLLYQNITVLALYGMTDDDYFCIPRHVRECVTDFEDSLPHQPELNCVPDVFPNLKRMHFSLDPGWTCRPLIKEGVFDDVDFEKFKLGIWGQLWKPMDYGGVIESYDDIFTEQSLAFADQYLNRDLFKNTRPGTIELILHRRMAFKTDHKQRLPVFNPFPTAYAINCHRGTMAVYTKGRPFPGILPEWLRHV